MITKVRSETIIDTIRKEHQAAITDLSWTFDASHNGFQETVSITVDRWILNDLNIILQEYRKEFINNEP